ncbi:nucleotidyl transferase AbiEii/AbiGii toxin family protein [Lewinella sp. JB7]|uniref:nucleotidyl transferase AbiEii/AbiGii toxin family protein n=1 Tax=Lewinella sp. JB7 TaxID=2962887 RepID=UPI0020C9E0CB|nr:nucleotidyl transferase AbiEii/AbiGii toxin family protein [Lewinella sp. JB7]MCP9236672.1 nucleotidyl transferase AbiEii/AbiGii toxin family protein [Lewinella sp. JB7]
MIEMEQILRYYPESLHTEKEFLLREYLQHEILGILFTCKYAHKYTFLGGTCLRLCYGTERFSEDLDFDNVGLDRGEFEETARMIKRQMELRGFKMELRYAYKGAYHCSIKFPGLLYDYNLSGHREAKLLIKLDTEKQHFEYERSLLPLDRFGIRTEVPAVPLDLLGSQKIAAILGRKRPKGRDFYDLRWILHRSGLNYGYLDLRFGVSTPEALRQLVADRTAPFDFDLLAADVRPFLFREEDIEGVRRFPEFWQSVPL